MNEGRPKWQRVAIVLSSLWSIVVVGLVVNALFNSPSFEAAAAARCSQFLVPLSAPVERAIQGIDSRLFFRIVRWQDSRSREIITPFRRGEQALHCDVLEYRAKVFLEGARAGIIVPRLTVHRRGLSVLIGIPCCLFFIACYLLFSRRSLTDHASTSASVAR